MIQDKLSRVRVAGAAAILFAAACGGGGGGGGGGSPPPPPPPPPSPPSAVTANAAVSASSVAEGQPFILNAAGSSTTNGQPLSYSWTQVSGPTVTIANPNSVQLTLSASEVTADTAAQFRVTVTAGTDTAQAVANVTFSNIAQTPAFANATVLATVTSSVTPRTLLGTSQFVVAGVADGSDPLTFLEFTVANGPLQGAASQLPSLPQSAKLQLTSFFPSNTGGAFPPLIAAIEETSNRFRVFARAFGGAISTVADFTLTAPCGMSNGTVLSGSGVYVGQRNGYSIIYGGGATPNIQRSVTLGRPACALVAPRTPIEGMGGFMFPGPTPAYYDLITVDTTANLVTVYQADGPGGAAQFVQVAQVPVQLDSAAPLSFVGWVELDSNGPSSSGMALVFSDGAFNGQHRLVIMGLNRSRALVQRTHSFSGPAPASVFLDNLDRDDFSPEVVITSPKSPQAVIFEPTTPLVGPGMPPLGSAQYFEIGLGATAAVPRFWGLVSPSGPVDGMLLAYPDKKEVKVVGPTP